MGLRLAGSGQWAVRHMVPCKPRWVRVPEGAYALGTEAYDLVIGYRFEHPISVGTVVRAYMGRSWQATVECLDDRCCSDYAPPGHFRRRCDAKRAVEVWAALGRCPCIE